MSESRKPRGAFRTFILALASCLALGAAGASTAGALTFEPNAELPANFTLSAAGNFAAYTESGGLEVRCDGDTTGSGVMEHEEHGTATLEFHGCWAIAFGYPSCSSDGAPSGTIVTTPLALDLAVLPEGELGAVFDSTGHFAEFDCNYLHEVKWTGSVIGEITDPGYSTTAEEMDIELNAWGAGEQQYTETAAGRKAQLVSYYNGDEGSQMGLDGGVTLGDLHSADVPFTLENAESEVPYLALAREKGFPASFSLAGGKSILRLDNSWTVECTPPKGQVFALTGNGEFSSNKAGSAGLTFTNCRGAFNVNCTTPGQAAGTIKTESLPVRLSNLSGSSPGLVIEANKTSGKIMSFNCSFLASVVVRGGMLAKIVSPKVGEESTFFTTDLNAVKSGEFFVQEYTETENGEKIQLKGELNGGKAEPTSLDSGFLAGLGAIELRD